MTEEEIRVYEHVAQMNRFGLYSTHEDMTRALELALEATKLPTLYEETAGWKRTLQSYTLPDEQDIEDIMNTALTHPRCRVTVETWEKRE